MRPTHSPLPRLLPTFGRPGASRRKTETQHPTEVKPPKKRCLNEAAHKLDR
ncbi:MAG TPA: hypothetical protein VMF14_19280 [Solirubrobacteraceae bacterium]|nr:hypothetical protein [Solirubrobacteraceae bacterium]